MTPPESPPPGGGEVDRFEAQRQAFSRLMARFTADRDAMIAAVQQCNERIDALALRFDGGEHPADEGLNGSHPANGSNGTAVVGEVRAVTERLLGQQQSALAELRTVSDRALQRADEALRRWREASEAASDKDAGIESARQELEKIGSRLARLEELFLAQSAAPPPAADDAAARELAERLGAMEEHVRHLDDSVDQVRHQMDRPTAQELASSQLVDVGMRDLREQMSQLETIAAWTPKLQRLWVSLVASAIVTAFAVIYVR